MKGSRCICGCKKSKRTKDGIKCSDCRNIISKTAFSYDANRNLASIFQVSVPDKIRSINHTYDSIDKNKKVYELKTTTKLEKYYNLKKHPLNALSNRGQKENIKYLDFIIIGLADWKTFKIKKAFVYNVKIDKIIKEVYK